jgi:beta-lactamase superfamily II metal-dependent hydrolase
VKSKDKRNNEAMSADQTFTTATGQTAPLTVHFIDVGQGDAILVDYGIYEILIDGGSSTPGVVGYLQNYVDGPLEVMVATHPHADHIGGLTAVLGTFDVQEVWYSGESSTSQTYSNFMSAVEAEGAEVHVARRGDVIGVGGLSFKVLNPANITGTTNNNSVVLELSYGQVDFLFEGDAEHEAEASMVAAGLVPDVEILKVGHHGSRTASSASFLAVAKLEVAVYMAGTGNTYGHPHAETIAALHAVGATIYGTDINGTVVVFTDGQTYSVTTGR